MRLLKIPVVKVMAIVMALLVGTGGSFDQDSSFNQGGNQAYGYGFFSSTAFAQNTDKDKKSQKYTCPMHPHYIASEMGSCPICGMDLVPLESSGDAAAVSAGDEKRQIVTIAAETVQNMGVRLAKVENTRFGRQIRAYGIVKENEKQQYVISSRIDGWIEKLNVRAVGDQVQKGAELYQIYSSELFVFQRDYLAARRAREKTRLRAMDIRLRSYGVQSKAISKLARSGKAMMQVPFYAQNSGVISKLGVSPGSFVKRGAMIAMIQDYSKVWLMVSVAEHDLGFLNKRSQVMVTFPTLKNKTAKATIDYIYPTVDAASRTGQVRLVIDNKDGRLRPGTYADVVFEVNSSQKLAVPTESLLNSENGRYVILSKGEGRFEPRSVKTGLVVGRHTEIIEGLKIGEDIVVSGQFLLDSESALHESFRKLQRLQTPLDLLTLDKSQMAMIDHLVDAALYLHEAQIDGYDVDAKFIEPARQIKNLLWPSFRHTQLAPVLKRAEKALTSAQEARSASQLHAASSELVKALRPWMVDGRPDYYKEKKLVLFEEKGEGRVWVQQGERPLNPYGKLAGIKIPYRDKTPPEKASPEKSLDKMPDDKDISMDMRGSHAQ